MKDGKPYVSTTNACKLCKPLGAAVAFRGIEGCVPFLHGSQGCATYMRRYVISHFREPVDIASSALGEKHAVYGGGPNLKKGLLNVMQKYGAQVIGVATTCLTETIGDDVGQILREFRAEFGQELKLPELVHVSTPSYEGTHMEGFHAAVRAVVEQLTESDFGPKHGPVACLPGFVSAEDLRGLKALFADFGLPITLLPDYSESLDGTAAADYEKLPPGGTPVAAIKALGGSRACIEFSRCQKDSLLAGSVLRDTHAVPLQRMGLPMGLRASDEFVQTLEHISGRPAPEALVKERGRLVDAMVDAHKYISGLKAVVYGEEDLAVGLTALLAEVGIHPVLVATGGEPARFEEEVAAVTEGLVPMPLALKGVDFYDIVDQAKTLAPDIVVGNSKGYRVLARELNIPLVRVGFPIHDRFGAQRVRHIGYAGTQELFDRIVNAVLEKRQEESPVGFMYI
ncbi:nitrogenase component 1 [Desulfocurvibacter africanus]|uniref:nitrogenase component 1 n=1 Tax=Desulfocurvibacter africanus TaxID=873 RepID=UPI000429B544|nr:nitrogenase component 1 [Desulfocurvibacter africanus]